MKEAIVNIWNSVMDSRHNPLRHMDLASQHYFNKQHAAQGQGVEHLGRASRCIWKLDSEA